MIIFDSQCVGDTSFWDERKNDSTFFWSLYSSGVGSQVLKSCTSEYWPLKPPLLPGHVSPRFYNRPTTCKIYKTNVSKKPSRGYCCENKADTSIKMFCTLCLYDNDNIIINYHEIKLKFTLYNLKINVCNLVWWMILVLNIMIS